MSRRQLSFGFLAIGILFIRVNTGCPAADAKPQAILVWPQGAPGAVGEEE